MRARFFTKDPFSDPRLTLQPLRGENSVAVAADLIERGQGECCADCGKPFNSARKQRGVARVSHIDPEGNVFTTAWLFCGHCTTNMRRNGNKIPLRLVEEARAGTSNGLRMAAPAQGSA